jgi:hypothetical protein
MPATKRAINFTNVKELAFNPKHKPAGEYRAKIVKVEDDESKQGNAQWIFTIVVTTDQRSTYPYYCGLDEKQAWKIRKLCIAAGIPVPKKRVMVDPNKLVNKEIGITLDDDEYEGKMKSTIVDTFPTDDLAKDSPEDEEKPRGKRSTTKKSAKPADDDEDDDVDGEDLDELDLEEV